ncbi:MAG: 3-phosphoglycerate dehydrogenase [Erysipelotrichaceae bacterium]|nr:3-phosphoglycerate dehydrogenase [Erysipelotrichaceae bacterium]
MYNVKLYNNIAQKGLDQFDDQYNKSADIENPDAILVRSANLHDIEYNPELKVIARAGAGVNNIDIDTCTEKTIVVFNTPGANANAVNELVFAGMLLASRDIYHGIEWCRAQTENDNLSKDVEVQKKKYGGHELKGQSLGIIGLGAIGVKVANLALRVGMDVHGYDPYLSVDAAWSLSRWVHREETIEDIFRKCDFITIHIPMNDATKGTINKKALDMMKDGVVVLNMARGGLVVEDDMLEALNSGKVAKYVTDFPSPKLVAHPNVIPTPHLGASTAESEENCAVQAALEIRDYLERGNIHNSVNMPEVRMEWTGKARVGIFHDNKPKMIARITDCFHDDSNIENMINKSKKGIAYTMLDLAEQPNEEAIARLKEIPGVLRVQVYTL